jgi:CMP-N,N'-diacetyllegionaminic acid synthase
MNGVQKVLGVIPARGGSKRIPRKNIRKLLGKPLIAYTIEEALKSELIDRLIVSTDDKETADIAKQYGAEVPFIRPADLAGDNVGDQPVFLHALERMDKLYSYRPDIVLNLRPTSPLKTQSTIELVIRKAIDGDVDIVRTMTRVEGNEHPFWMYKLSKSGLANAFMEDIDINQYYQSQLLPPIYRLNAVVDAYKTKQIYENSILSGKTHGLEIPIIETIDIDTELDFRFCEFLLKEIK